MSTELLQRPKSSRSRHDAGPKAYKNGLRLHGDSCRVQHQTSPRGAAHLGRSRPIHGEPWAVTKHQELWLETTPLSLNARISSTLSKPAVTVNKSGSLQDSHPLNRTISSITAKSLSLEETDDRSPRSQLSPGAEGILKTGTSSEIYLHNRTGYEEVRLRPEGQPISRMILSPKCVIIEAMGWILPPEPGNPTGALKISTINKRK